MQDVEEEDGGDSEGEGEVQAAVPGRRCLRAHKAHPACQMQRDMTVSWNLWEVCITEYVGNPRPGYLTRVHNMVWPLRNMLLEEALLLHC
eukprot:1156705-Pelagomonas_calceolata.AAC.6